MEEQTVRVASTRTLATTILHTGHRTTSVPQSCPASELLTQLPFYLTVLEVLDILKLISMLFDIVLHPRGDEWSFLSWNKIPTLPAEKGRNTASPNRCWWSKHLHINTPAEEGIKECVALACMRKKTCICSFYFLLRVLPEWSHRKRKENVYVKMKGFSFQKIMADESKKSDWNGCQWWFIYSLGERCEYGDLHWFQQYSFQYNVIQIVKNKMLTWILEDRGRCLFIVIRCKSTYMLMKIHFIIKPILWLYFIRYLYLYVNL